MFFEKSLSIATFLLVFNIHTRAAFIMHANSSSTITISAGQHIDLTEMMEILQNQTAELRKLKQQTESDGSTIQLLQNRVLFLETESKTNDEYNKNITRRLNDAVSNLENMKVEMRYTSLSMLDVHSKTEQLNTTLLKVFNDGLSGVSEQIANIHVTRKVAFTVGVSSLSTSWTGSTLVFPRVVYNIGGGYDQNTGVFTSPVDGHFVFFVNVQSYSTNDIRTYLVLNGTPKVTTMAYTSGYSSAPNLAVLRLQKGDRVWVKYFTGIGYYTEGAAPVTTFSGFLI